MFLPITACLDALGIASGAIQDPQISVSSAITNGGSDRSRLNMTALSRKLSNEYINIILSFK